MAGTLSAYKVHTGTTAPVIVRPSAPKVISRPQRSAKELKIEAKRSNIYAFRIILVSVALFSLLVSPILIRVQIMETSAEIDKIQAQYSEAQSENARLESEVKAMYSENNIASYAEDELGMIKKDNCRINYYSVE